MTKPSNPSPKGEPSQPGEPGGEFPPHPIVAKLLGTSRDHRDTLVVFGYLGSPNEAGIVRIYLDLGLQAYLEMPKERVLHCDRPDPSNETQPTKIIIDASVPLTLV